MMKCLSVGVHLSKTFKTTERAGGVEGVGGKLGQWEVKNQVWYMKQALPARFFGHCDS